MDWVIYFERKFSIVRTDENAPYLIIEGKSPYLQKLGSTSLAVSIAQHKQFLNTHGCNVYDNFDVISFMVNSWIKIQDSLEMIFNLLTGSSIKSLRVLCYLRQNSIPTHEFALYLFQTHKIILINRFTSSKHSQLLNTELMIQTLSSHCHVLIVGNNAYKRIQKLSKVDEIGIVRHPSGVVLNTCSDDYFDTWYQLDDTACTYTTNNFSLSNFQRLS